jgi:ATP-dependent Clp protease ATP-binding subunit ClpB
MNFDKYTDKSKSIVQKAQNSAVAAGHQKFAPIHILKALVEDEDAIIKDLLTSAGGNVGVIEGKLAITLGKLPSVTGGGAGQIYLDADTAKLFEKAEELAKKASDSFVTLERILQAIIALKNTEASNVLKDAGVTEAKLTAAIDEMRKGRTADTQHAEEGFDALKKYAKDLTEQARPWKARSSYRA